MGFQSNRRRKTERKKEGNKKQKQTVQEEEKQTRGAVILILEKHVNTFGSFSCTTFVTVLKIFKLSATETWSKLMSPEISYANHKLKIETVPNMISTKPITHISKAVFNYL
jgi:hypothetical protein